MRMVWLKLYDEILEDPKIQTLPEGTFKFWINVLAIANRQKVRGLLPSIEVIAFLLRLTPDDATIRMAQLVAASLVDETPDGLTPHNWKDRQRKQDATGAERAQRHRDRIKASGSKPKSASRVTGRDAGVTSRVTGRDVTPRNDFVTATSRTDTEEDKYNTPQPPRGGAVSVSTNGSEPEPVSKALPSEPARPPFDDAELTRVGMRAEKLFPMADFGGKIRAIAGDGPSEFPLAWIDSALTEMHASDKRDWRYLMGILRRYAADGGPKPSAQSGPRIHNPNPPPPPGGRYHRSPATLARLAEQARARATMESAAS